MAAAQVAVAHTARLLALLGEDDRTLQEHALRGLNGVVDSAWPEASELITTIEALSEDESLPAASRQLAAAVASKVRARARNHPRGRPREFAQVVRRRGAASRTPPPPSLLPRRLGADLLPPRGVRRGRAPGAGQWLAL